MDILKMLAKNLDMLDFVLGYPEKKGEVSILLWQVRAAGAFYGEKVLHGVAAAGVSYCRARAVQHTLYT